MTTEYKGITPENELYVTTLGYRIRKIRHSLGLSMSDFSKIITPPAASSNVSNWEMNNVSPNAERLRSISELGKVSLQYLLTGNEIIPDNSLSLNLFLNENKFKSLNKNEKIKFEKSIRSSLNIYNEVLDHYIFYDITPLNIKTGSEFFIRTLDTLTEINQNILNVISTGNSLTITDLQNDLNNNIQKLMSYYYSNINKNN
jgi:transcriptional regulator with XRE-family HTH domain